MILHQLYSSRIKPNLKTHTASIQGFSKESHILTPTILFGIFRKALQNFLGTLSHCRELSLTE